MVGLKRSVEAKKVEKIQTNLHLIDFPKQNQHLFFINDPKEVKARPTFDSDELDHNLEKKFQGEKDRYLDELKVSQSQNKGQYKKLADAMEKEEQLSRVQEALVLDKHMKSGGKKRKLENEEGKVYFKWFNERKR